MQWKATSVRININLLEHSLMLLVMQAQFRRKAVLLLATCSLSNPQ